MEGRTGEWERAQKRELEFEWEEEEEEAGGEQKQCWLQPSVAS
jgi:hypothetical protein